MLQGTGARASGCRMKSREASTLFKPRLCVDERAHHKESSSVICYYANPYHSWERGMNDYTNGLICQYLPKKICMKSVSQDHCDRIAHQLNTRPRKRHDYKTPYELYNQTGSPLHFAFEPRLILYIILA